MYEIHEKKVNLSFLIDENTLPISFHAGDFILPSGFCPAFFAPQFLAPWARHLCSSSATNKKLRQKRHIPMSLLTELENLVEHFSTNMSRLRRSLRQLRVLNPRFIRGENDSIGIGSPRQAFLVKLCASCESSPLITEPSASASR
jgi:hypothetical protein